MRRSRQADIARAVGVSQSTVSSVISGQADRYGIAEETRQRILAAARELGYVPSAAARKLRGAQNRLLGVHTFEPVFPISRRNFYHDFLVGVEEQAVAEEYDLVLFTAAANGAQVHPIFRDGHNRLSLADGSVLLGVEQGGQQLTQLAASGYPFVHIGRREVDGHDVAYVSPDYHAAVAQIVHRLAGLGHRRITYLPDIGSPEPYADRRAGYRDGCAELGLPARIETPDDASSPNPQWLTQVTEEGITAVLMESYGQGRQLAAAARHRGLRLPEDLSVVLLNDAGGTRRATQRWSVLGVPRRELGREAVRLLLDILNGEPSERHRLLPCEPPDSTTIGPAPLS